MKQVVDSSGWLEFFADGLNAAAFAAPLAKPADLIVPVITIYEVFNPSLTPVYHFQPQNAV